MTGQLLERPEKKLEAKIEACNKCGVCISLLSNQQPISIVVM